jgi:hypothetical protein
MDTHGHPCAHAFRNSEVYNATCEHVTPLWGTSAAQFHMHVRACCTYYVNDCACGMHPSDGIKRESIEKPWRNASLRLFQFSLRLMNIYKRSSLIWVRRFIRINLITNSLEKDGLSIKIIENQGVLIFLFFSITTYLIWLIVWYKQPIFDIMCSNIS